MLLSYYQEACIRGRNKVRLLVSEVKVQTAWWVGVGECLNSQESDVLQMDYLCMLRGLCCVVLCLWAAVGFDEGSEAAAGAAVERVEQKTEE